MWRGPTAVSTELGPRIGRSGDSPVSEGACSGLAVNSERTWSGWLVITGPPGIVPRIRKTSPSSRRARKTNSIWRWLKRSDWVRRGSGIAGGVASPASSASSIGPAGDGGASPTSWSGAGGSASIVAVLGGIVSTKATSIDAHICELRLALYSAPVQANSETSGAHVERRTKIIATIGPASWGLGVVEQLISAGADVFRLNFSHAGPERQAETTETIRRASETVGREVALLGDLPGQKLRIGDLRDDVAELETGMHVTLTPEKVEGDAGTIPVPWSGVTELREDQHVYLADGAIRLRVCDPEPGGVDCEVEVGGTLSPHKGMDIPGGTAVRSATEGDLDWVEFAVSHGIDLLAVSFVSSAADLVQR